MVEGILKSGRIASAYLFSGPAGESKNETVTGLLERLGCREVDRLRIVPDGASIRIEQIRELPKLTRFGPTLSPRLVVVIESADKMTDQAAAAFLKTLEEPHEKVTFILLVEREDQLPATILSRCQRIRFGEDNKIWQRQPELAPWYAALQGIGRLSVPQTFDLSAKLEKEKERIEELLYELVFFSQHELRDIKLVRILLETIKTIKRKASLKLALDVGCLKLREACQNKN